MDQQQQVFAEQSQIATTPLTYTAAGIKVFKIPAGVYLIDQCQVKINFAYNDNLANTHFSAIRKEFPLFFQGECVVTVDSEVYARYSNLLCAQEMYHWTFHNNFNNLRDITQDSVNGGGYTPNMEVQPLIQGTGGAVGWIEQCYAYPLRKFLPFLFSESDKYFKIEKQMEVSLYYGGLANYLLDGTSATLNFANLANVNSDVLSGHLIVEFQMRKHLDQQVEYAKPKYVQLKQETATQTTTEIGVQDPSKQVSKFQCVLMQDVNPTAMTVGQLTAANLTSCKIQRNNKNLIQASQFAAGDNSVINCQFASYQLQNTGVFLLPQWTSGVKFEYKIQNQGAADSHLSFLIQYQNI